jgi:hypothetical protein
MIPEKGRFHPLVELYGEFSDRSETSDSPRQTSLRHLPR